MDYKKFETILNKHIFSDEKVELLRKIAERPERYIGLFRPTKPAAKILQNLLQSHEIRFGDALEELFTEIIEEKGFTNLPKDLYVNGEKLSLDQYFSDGEKFYFIEQKVRDDHDSTKKRGQIQNFEKKLEILYRKHDSAVVGILYFVDPDLKKNKNFYERELITMRKDYGVPLYLYYGEELFNKFFKDNVTWESLIKWLKKWKNNLPELPEINMDLTPKESAREIQNLPIRHWRKLLNTPQLWEEGIMKAIFRTGDTLRIVAQEYISRKEKPYQTIGKKLLATIKEYY